MKGISSIPEIIEKILIVVFIVGVTAIVVSTYLPAFGGDACRQKQSESMNKLISGAISVRTETVRNFDVEGGCVEYILFECTENTCTDYKTRYIGKSDDVTNDLPGGDNVIEIFCSGCEQVGDNLKLLKGSYIARISPYTIKFSRELCDDKTKPECQPVPA